ncbi:hypothetical protein [Actinoplanes sp. NPDC049681]|uniref:hypothetical protein n=1 Tax=Actinoplanes sp. NPDC049681 TaxID=3363905 RepID=UPI0037952F55
MKSQDSYTVDPEPAADLARWAIERARKARQLADARARADALTAQLQSPAAQAAMQARAVAQTELTKLASAELTAQSIADEADTAAARFESGDLLDAQARLDQATRDIADALALLLREASTSVSLTAAVDGSALRERYRRALATTPPTWDHTTIPFLATPTGVVDPDLRLPIVDPSAGSEYQRLLSVLDRLDDRVDSIADLMTAESVHQMVQGNPARAGGALEIAASGLVPDELDVIAAPRPGHDVLHRLLILVDPALQPAWPVRVDSLAARADPLAAAWVSGLLPDPAGAVAVVDGIDVPADELGLDPLDWLRMATAPAELAARIAAAVGATGQVEVDLAGLGDLLAAAAAAGRLLGRVRAAGPDDLAHPHATPAPADPTDLRSRVKALQDAVTSLTSALENGEPSVALLLKAAALGVPEAVPSTADPAVLRSLADAAIARLRARLADPLASDATADACRARVERLCGVRLPLLTTFPVPLDPAARDDLEPGATRLSGATPAAVRDWIADQARVAPATAALRACLDLAEVLGARERLDPRVTQLPITTPDVWAGATDVPRAGAVSLVVQSSYGAALPDAAAGMVVEAWNQEVAAPSRQAGVAVHHDRPEGQPPSALLVAVHPDPAGSTPTWDLDTLLGIVTAALALARHRVVAAERRDRAGVSLPDPA